MKKVIVLFLLIVLGVRLSANTVSGAYNLDINEYINCIIELYPDNRYDISLLISHTEDLIEEKLISFGKYKKSSNMIILTDTIYEFSIQLCYYPDKRMKVSQGFVFMKDKFFTYSGKSGTYSIERKNEVSDLAFQQLRYQKQERKIYNLFPKDFSLPMGKYETGYDIFNKYELHLQKEHNKYFLYDNHFLLSEGTWSRNINEVALYDENLKKSFYVLIGKNELISKYLPGEYYGTSLKFVGPSLEKPSTKLAEQRRKPLQPDSVFSTEEEEEFDTYNGKRIYIFTEEFPSFPGGNDKMMEWVQANIQYPKEYTYDKNGERLPVYVKFLVDEQGNIINPKVLKEYGAPLTDEALRLVKLMPKFIPGKHMGKTVISEHIIVIEFWLKKK